MAGKYRSRGSGITRSAIGAAEGVASKKIYEGRMKKQAEAFDRNKAVAHKYRTKELELRHKQRLEVDAARAKQREKIETKRAERDVAKVRASQDAIRRTEKAKADERIRIETNRAALERKRVVQREQVAKRSAKVDRNVNRGTKKMNRSTVKAKAVKGVW